MRSGQCFRSLGRTSLVVGLVIAATTFGIAEIAEAGTCPTGSACLGRASYTTETSGSFMMYSSYIAGNDTNYENLNSRSYDDSSTVNNRSWRIRNRLASSRKICVYDGFDLNNSLYVEVYSTTVYWDAGLPDDQASSWHTTSQLGNC